MDRLSQVYLEGWGDVQTGTQFVDVPINGQVDNVMSVEVPVFTTEQVADIHVVLDTREYDADSREVFSGPAPGSLDPDYVNKLVAGNYDLSGAQSTVSFYDAKGQLFSQHTVNVANASLSSDTRYTQYDAAGNLTHYESTTGNVTTEYQVDIEALDGYKEKDSIGNNGSGGPVEVDDQYDANGYLVGLTGAAADARTFVNDADGHVLQKKQNGHIETEWIVDGEVIATDGTDAAGKSVQTFDLSYTPVTNSYPNATTGQYPVQSGDTLETIAQAAYGDSSLWYVIADANGLQDDGDLRVGQVLTVPTKLNGTHSNSTTVTPYDPSKIVGSTAPNVPAPPPAKGGCGIVGTIIMIIVAVVVTYFTAGAATGALLSAYAAATGAAVAAGSAAAIAIGVAGLAIAGAVGSIASQLVGMAIGQTKGFSWKQVGIAAVTEVLTAGVGDGAGGGVADFGVAVVNGAVSSAAAQEVSIGLGLQKNFSWRQVAAAGVSSGVGEELGSVTAGLVKTGDINALTAQSVTALGSSAASMEIQDHGHAQFKNIFAQAAGSVAASYVESGVENGVASFLGETSTDVRAWDQNRAATLDYVSAPGGHLVDYVAVGRAVAGYFGISSDSSDTAGVPADAQPSSAAESGATQAPASVAQYFAMAGGKGPLNDGAANAYMNATLKQSAVANDASRIAAQSAVPSDPADFAAMDFVTPFAADVAGREAASALKDLGFTNSGTKANALTYIVGKNDTYAGIARDYYGDERYANAILAANNIDPTYANVHKLQIGAPLQLPDLAGLSPVDDTNQLRTGGALIAKDQQVTGQLAAAAAKRAAAQQQTQSAPAWVYDGVSFQSNDNWLDNPRDQTSFLAQARLTSFESAPPLPVPKPVEPPPPVFVDTQHDEVSYWMSEPSEATVAATKWLEDNSAATRIMGGLQMIGGFGEMSLGGSLVVAGGVTAETGVGLVAMAGGGALVVGGADQFQTGWRTLLTGVSQQSAINASLQYAGASPEVAGYLDMGLNGLGSIGATGWLQAARAIPAFAPGAMAASSEALGFESASGTAARVESGSGLVALPGTAGQDVRLLTLQDGSGISTIESSATARELAVQQSDMSLVAKQPLAEPMAGAMAPTSTSTFAGETTLLQPSVAVVEQTEIAALLDGEPAAKSPAAISAEAPSPVSAGPSDPRIGVPFSRSPNPLSPVQEVDVFGNEIYHRTMSEQQVELLQQTGELPPTTETSISPNLAYSSKYNGITVKLVVQPGTSEALQEIGIAANRPAALQLPELPVRSGPWMETNARFKVEQGQMTTQLGKGAALDIFNDNLIAFERVGRPVGNTSSRAVGETPPLLTLSRQPGTVVRNALTDTEFAQAQDLATFRGGQFVGAPIENFPGIDGWLDDVPIQMKTVTGNGEQAILRNIVKGAGNMSAQGYVGDIAIDATQTGATVDSFANFVKPGTPVGRILNEGSVNNVYIKLGDGWLNITQGTLVVPGK